jgi:glycosyltransferase involved in cell wall biosynthesis
MRILAITNMYPSAEFPGRGVFVQEQVKGLRAIGLEVQVLFVDRRKEGPLVYYKMRDKIRSSLAGLDPDVIHVMYGGVMADQIVRRHHFHPTVVTFRGSDLLGENLSGWTRKLVSRYGVYCSRRAARAADGVVVVARHLMGALNGAASADKVRVVTSGIDLDRFKPMDPLVCKQKLGWSIRSFHVLFASSSGDPVKRPELARAAVAQMSESERPAEFHYLSGIPTAEMPLWLNAGDALLLTSLHEGSPNIVKEALACGLPVVSVDVGDVAERIEGVEGCYLARSGPADLAAKLSLVRQRAQRLECGARLEELSILNIAHKLKRCYEEISRERSARRYTTRGGRSLPAIHSAEQAAASVRQ